MDATELLKALVLGLIEGLTEFIPVSSTAHILLAGEFLGFENPGKTFEVMIQLGAILAVLTVYFGRLARLFTTFPSDPGARRFTAGVLVAFLPAAILGALGYGFIKGVLFESPRVIAIVLIVGGILLFIVDRLPLKPRYRSVMSFPLPVFFGIGLFQCLALIPGMSRSGSTIAGALLLGADKKAAADFSFWLAMPTMAGAFAYDLMKNRAAFDAHQSLLVLVGFVAAFFAALLVVRKLIDFVGRRGFAPFALWRIVVGGAALAFLGLG